MAPRDRPPPSAAEDAPVRRLGTLLASRPGRWLLRSFVVALGLLAAGTVVRHARAQAWRLPSHRIGPTTVRFVEVVPRELLDPDMWLALNDPRRLPLDVSVFDPRAEEKVAEVLARHPMVGEVRRIVVEYPNHASVSVRLRIPVARVAVAGTEAQEVLADDRHVLDPVPYRRWLRTTRRPLPLVLGVRSRPPPPGEPWEDREEQVAEALEAARVAAMLHRDSRGRVSVAQIDVSRFPARPEERAEGEVRFRLTDGRVVEWGRTDRDPAEVGEDPYGVKVRRLEAWLDDDALSRRRRLDVRYRTRFEGPARAP